MPAKEQKVFTCSYLVFIQHSVSQKLIACSSCPESRKITAGKHFAVESHRLELIGSGKAAGQSFGTNFFLGLISFKVFEMCLVIGS
jgi:hypothetical protein